MQVFYLYDKSQSHGTKTHAGDIGVPGITYIELQLENE